MAGIEPNVPSLLVFGVLWAAACLAFLHLMGMLPLQARPEGAQGTGGTWLVLGNGALFLAILIGTLCYAWLELRWTSVIVVGGVVFLFMPDALQACPARLRDGRAGLLALLAVQAGALGLLLSCVA
jgi:hypothetical protein